MTESDTDILRIVAEHRNVTSAGVAALTGRNQVGSLRRLLANGLIDGDMRGEVLAYWITPVGTRLLAKIDNGMGDYPQPRAPISKEPYTGEKWTNPRPGSDQHKQYGYRRPLLIASNVQVGKGVQL